MLLQKKIKQVCNQYGNRIWKLLQSKNMHSCVSKSYIKKLFFNHQIKINNSNARNFRNCIEERNCPVVATVS